MQGFLVSLDSPGPGDFGEPGHVVFPARDCLPRNCPVDLDACGIVDDPAKLYGNCMRPNITVSPLFRDITYYFGVRHPVEGSAVKTTCAASTCSYRLRVWIVPNPSDSKPVAGSCTSLKKVSQVQ
jgi:hypothetical protein